MSNIWLTKAYPNGNTKIAVMQSGDNFKIMKHCINYVRGKNIESWRVMGSASEFKDLNLCMDKFGKLVNEHRVKTGKEKINFIVE